MSHGCVSVDLVASMAFPVRACLRLDVRLQRLDGGGLEVDLYRRAADPADDLSDGCVAR